MSLKKKILVIDDDEKLCLLLSEYLIKFGFEVVSAYTAEEGLKKLALENPDLLILDIMLPGQDGLTVCKEIRRGSTIPIIMLTARGDVVDRIVGLEIGADDYLTKPFEPRELVARLQSVLRRASQVKQPEIIRVGPVQIDLNRQSLKILDQPVELTTMEYTILEIFVKNSGRVLTREKLMDALKGMDWDVYDRSIDVLISRLRQKLNDDPRNPTFIKTIRGSGYSFIGNENA